jgi:hypothetical protein
MLARIPVPRGQPLLLVFYHQQRQTVTSSNQARLTYRLASHIPPIFADIEFLPGKLNLLGEGDPVSAPYLCLCLQCLHVLLAFVL